MVFYRKKPATFEHINICITKEGGATSNRDGDEPGLDAMSHAASTLGLVVQSADLQGGSGTCSRSSLKGQREAAEAGGEDAHLPSLDPNANNVRVFYAMELDQLFRDLVAHPAAVEMVKAVLGKNFFISNFTANITRPGSRSMALYSDHDLENGATRSIPGSNRCVYRSQGPANAPDLPVPFEGKAREIIVMNGRVWHTSGTNVMEDEDRALLFGH
ncbi:hypothetical protein DL764_004988 [Monosporascus ibericus]|uniref:Uncharacterized protein n=1 Tax=Monosporascus ibericus TaxID=155417 RepID=A0A4Q4TAK9_9PEZI|nr:hypothetical protein DL764_004988 [Monosporascus ibericus]